MAELLSISQNLPSTRFPAGSFLIRQGEKGDVAWLILEGEADAYTDSETGPRRVGRFLPPQVVGEMALIDQGPRTATVVARSEVIAAEIPRAAFEKLLAECEPLARHILAHLINAIRAERGLTVSIPKVSGPTIRSTRDSERILERRVFGPGHIIFRESDPAEAAYLIQSGIVAIRRGDKQLAQLGPGRTFGEVALLAGTRRTAEASAIGDGVTVEVVRRREFEAATNTMPKILQSLTRCYVTYLADFGG